MGAFDEDVTEDGLDDSRLRLPKNADEAGEDDDDEEEEVEDENALMRSLGEETFAAIAFVLRLTPLPVKKKENYISRDSARIKLANVALLGAPLQGKASLFEGM